MDQTELKYPEKPPHFSIPGTYSGWIAGTKQPTGRSAMSVELKSEDPNEPLYHFAAASNAADSTEQRAFARGLIDLCEAVTKGSTLLLYSRSTYLGSIVELAEKWSVDGWRNSSGPIPNEDLVKRYLQVRNERRLQVSHKHCAKNRTEHDKTLKRLHDEAHRLAL
jgi:hypothetical protein